MCLKRFISSTPYVLAICLLAGLVWAVHDEGLFELEGNVADEAAMGDDWENIADGTDSANAVTSGTTGGIILDPIDNRIDMIFTGGGSKDDLDIPGWQFTTGSVPPKDDLTDAAAAAYQDADGDLIIYFMADRFAVNGTAQMGFWFFQDNVGPVDDPEDPDYGKFTGQHQNGDVLILAEFTQGGAIPDVDVWVWDEGNGTVDPEEGGSANTNLRFVGQFGECNGADDLACAVSNAGVVTPFWPRVSKGGGSDILINGLFEGGINITELFPEASGCFSSFLAETRSSHSVDAVLKDFVSGGFNLCGVAASKSCSAAINPSGDGANIVFNGTTTNSGSLTVTTQVTDSEAGSTFTAACIDVNEDNDPDLLCDDSGDIALVAGAPDNLTGLGTGMISFTHGPGVTVSFDGMYSTMTLSDTTSVPGFDFSDTITVDTFLDTNEPAVASTTASADCSAVGTPGIAVFKACTAGFDGTTATFTIDQDFDGVGGDDSGYAENTGNVALTSVMLSDTVISLTIAGEDHDKNGTVDAAFDNILAPGHRVIFSGSTTSTTSTSHTNTVTASGANTFDVSDTVSAMATANCGFAPAPAVALSKVCDDNFGGGTGVQLIQQGGVVVVQVHNIISVSNTGDTALSEVLVSDSDVMQLVQTAGPTFDCSAGTSCIGSLGVGESATFKQSYLPDGNNILNVLTNPGSVEFQNTASVGAKTTFTGGTIITDSDQTDNTASCPICPACPDCEQEPAN